jgi:DNA mismatch endonuclease (patch repair protein)
VSDVFSPEKRSQVMRRVRGRDTRPERKVRSLLTHMGLRYRLHRRDLPGSPDVVFGKKRVALFVHGCFWHGHDCARGARTPKTNADYWIGKIGRNRARDAEVQRRLAEAGWRTLVVWECELKDEARLAERLAAELDAPFKL